MIIFETNIEIRRPVEVVFAFVSDPHNKPQWQPMVKEVRVTPDGPPAVGTQVTKVGSFLGVKLELTQEITALEPNRSLTSKGSSGPLAVEGTYRFETAGEGTRLSSTFQVEPGRLFKVAGPILADQAKKQLEADLQRRKRTVRGARITRIPAATPANGRSLRGHRREVLDQLAAHGSRLLVKPMLPCCCSRRHFLAVPPRWNTRTPAAVHCRGPVYLHAGSKGLRPW